MHKEVFQVLLWEFRLRLWLRAFGRPPDPVPDVCCPDAGEIWTEGRQDVAMSLAGFDQEPRQGAYRMGRRDVADLGRLVRGAMEIFDRLVAHQREVSQRWVVPGPRLKQEAATQEA